MSMEDVMARISEIEDRIRALWPERAAVTAESRLQAAERIPDGDTGTQARPFPVALAQAGGSVQVRPAAARLAPPVELLIQKYGAQYGLDPNLIRAVITVESDGNPNTISRKGAKGLMQLMPEEIAAYGIRNPFDPEESIAGGTRQLAEKLKLFNGDLGLALAAYNAGSGAVRKYNGIPPFPETQNYVQRVFSLLGMQDSR